MKYPIYKISTISIATMLAFSSLTPAISYAEEITTSSTSNEKFEFLLNNVTVYNDDQVNEITLFIGDNIENYVYSVQLIEDGNVIFDDVTTTDLHFSNPKEGSNYEFKISIIGENEEQSAIKTLSFNYSPIVLQPISQSDFYLNYFEPIPLYVQATEGAKVELFIYDDKSQLVDHQIVESASNITEFKFNLPNEGNYKYTVRSSNNFFTKSFNGVYIYDKTPPETISSTKISRFDSRIDLTWQKSNGAYNYMIEYAKIGEPFEFLNITKDTEYAINTDGKFDSVYAVRITPMDESGNNAEPTIIKELIQQPIDGSYFNIGETLNFSTVTSYPASYNVQTILYTNDGSKTIPYTFESESGKFQASYTLDDSIKEITSYETKVMDGTKVVAKETHTSPLKAYGKVVGKLSNVDETAQVSLLSNKGETYVNVNQDGTFSLDKVVPGNYNVRYFYMGNINTSDTIDVPFGETVTADYTFPDIPTITFNTPSVLYTNSRTGVLSGTVSDNTTLFLTHKKSYTTESPIQLEIVGNQFSYSYDLESYTNHNFRFSAERNNMTTTSDVAIYADYKAPYQVFMDNTVFTKTSAMINWHDYNSDAAYRITVKDENGLVVDEAEVYNENYYEIQKIQGGKTYNVSVVAFDQAGNESLAATKSVSVPGPNFFSSATDYTNNKNMEVFYYPDGADTLKASIYFEDELLKTLNLDVNSNPGKIEFTGEKDGNYRVVLEGTKYGTSAVYETNILLDQKPIKKVSNIQVKQDSYLKLQWDAVPYAKNYTVIFDGKEYTTADPVLAYLKYNQYVDYTVEIYTNDQFGGKSEAATIDIAAHYPKLDVSFPVSNYTNEKTITIDGSTSNNMSVVAVITDPLGKVSTYDMDVNQNTFTHTIPLLMEGNYQVMYYGTRDGEQISTSKSFEVKWSKPDAVEKLAINDSEKAYVLSWDSGFGTNHFEIEVYDENDQLLYVDQTGSSNYLFSREISNRANTFKVYRVDYANNRSTAKTITTHEIGETPDDTKRYLTSLEDMVMDDNSYAYNLNFKQDNTTKQLVIKSALMKELISKGSSIRIQADFMTYSLSSEQLEKALQQSYSNDLVLKVSSEHDSKISPYYPIYSISIENSVSANDWHFDATMDLSKISGIDSNIVTILSVDEMKKTSYLFNKLNNQTLHFTVSSGEKFVLAQNKVSFFDVPESKWSAPYIYSLAAKQIFKGTNAEGTQFSPTKKITRAEFASLLSRMLNLKTQDYQGVFNDVPANHWAALDVEAAAKAGIVSGVANGKFDLNAPITREQLVTMITRAIEYKNPAILKDVQSTTTFVDANQVSDFAKNNVSIASALNIVGGVNVKNQLYFYPKNNATREEAAKMLYELLKKL